MTWIVRVLAIAGLALGLMVPYASTVEALGAPIQVSYDFDARDFWPGVAQAPDGKLTSIWVSAGGATAEIRAATSEGQGSSWSSEVSVANYNPSEYLDRARIVYDSNGNLHAVWMQGLGTSRSIYHYYVPAGQDPHNPGNWHSGEKACRNCVNPNLTADRSGNVYLIYDNRGNDKIEIRRTGGPNGGWDGAIQGISGGGQPAIAVTSDGKLQIAYLNEGKSITYARYTSFFNFNQEYSNSISGFSNDNPDIYADAADHVHIVWRERNGPNNAGVAYYREVVNGSVSGSFPVGSFDSDNDNFITVAGDSNGNAYVAWIDYPKDLFIRSRINGQWEAQQQITGQGEYPEFEVSLGGTVDLAYIDSQGTRFLHVQDGLGFRRTANDGFDTMGATQPRTAWYFAEGFTGDGFDEYIALLNPRGSAANVTIIYYLEGGGTINKNLTVAANDRATIAVHETAFGVGRGKAVSAKVTSNVPIVAERSMYFLYLGTVDGAHNALGATDPSTSWYFAEGYTGPGFDEYLTIQNPNSASGQANIQYFKTGGGIEQRFVNLPPNSRTTVQVHNAATPGGLGRDQPGAGHSTRVVTSVPTIVERPMYFTYGGAAGGPGTADGGHLVIGANTPRTTWLFGEGYTGPGFDEYLTIQNPGAAGTATITYYLTGGGSPVTRSVPLPPNSRTTVQVHKPNTEPGNPGGLGRDPQGTGHSTRVVTSVPTIVERPMYFNYVNTANGGPGVVDGGHDVSGANAASATWYFAEGNTNAGFDEFITIQNPGATAGVATITYYLQGAAGVVTTNVNLPAASRTTVQVHNGGTPGALGRDQAHGTKITSTVPVVVERPMYVSYNSEFK